MRITETKLRRIIRGVLSESQEDPRMAQLVALENEWWSWCNGGNASTYSMEEMGLIEDQINKLKAEMGLPIHDQEYGWAYGDGSPPVHPTELRKHMMNEGWRRIIREFGEDDAQLRKKLQNRDKMIGRGIDGGTIGYNPNWDYDKKVGVAQKPKGYIDDVLKQVPAVIESSDMHGWAEVEPTRDPNVIYIVSGDFSCKVQNDYGTFKFSVVKPAAWKGWTRECESIDAEIDNVLYEMQVYIDEKENG